MQTFEVQVSETGKALTRFHEKLRLTSYRDPFSGKWTVGYGCTGVEIVKGMNITAEAAESLFQVRMLAIQNALILNLNLTKMVTPGQIDALADFAYNLGIHELFTSHLWACMQSQKYAEALAEFPRFCHVTLPSGVKVENAELIKRRADEARMFQGMGWAPPKR